MSDVKPQKRQQAVLTAILSWLALGYIAGVGCACICAGNGQATASDLNTDVRLTADLDTVQSSAQEVDARLLPALATVERIQSLATAARLESHRPPVDLDTQSEPVSTLDVAPKLSPPSIA
jgi:hypothetical protein